jgi:outer membrane lipopolysaccharide assembly protein LptE/RlpB
MKKIVKLALALAILLMSGCDKSSKNYQEIHGDINENCCESDINIEPATNDNTIILSIDNEEIVGYCYVGWNS